MSIFSITLFDAFILLVFFLYGGWPCVLGGLIGMPIGKYFAEKLK